MKKTAQKGDKVAVNYEGRTEDGVLFDTSIKEVAQAEGLPLRASYAPLEFTVGAGQMIKGFDAAVVGMAVGDIKTVKILPADAYGQPDPSMVLTINTSQITQQVNQSVKVGMTLYTPNGASGKIISTDANITKVDFNSPLAGKTLTFKITMVKIG